MYRHRSSRSAGLDGAAPRASGAWPERASAPAVSPARMRPRPALGGSVTGRSADSGLARQGRAGGTRRHCHGLARSDPPRPRRTDLAVVIAKGKLGYLSEQHRDGDFLLRGLVAARLAPFHLLSQADRFNPLSSRFNISLQTPSRPASAPSFLTNRSQQKCVLSR